MEKKSPTPNPPLGSNPRGATCSMYSGSCEMQLRVASRAERWMSVWEVWVTPLTMYAPHVQTFAPGCVSPLQTNTKVECKIKQTNKLTNKQFHRQSQGWIGRTTGDTRETSIPRPVQGRRTTLLDVITQAHSTAHMQQNATRIIPLPNSLLAGTFFFIHLWTFTSSTVSQSVFCVFFVDLFFFSLQPSIGWVLDLFWDFYFSEFGCVGFDTCRVFEYFGCDFGLALFFRGI